MSRDKFPRTIEEAFGPRLPQPIDHGAIRDKVVIVACLAAIIALAVLAIWGVI